MASWVAVAALVLVVLLSVGKVRGAVRLDFSEEVKARHPAKRALLIPHILPFSNGDQSLNMKDEVLILGMAAAIIRSNRYNELTLLEKYTEPSRTFAVESHHVKTLTDFAKTLPTPSVTKVRVAVVESNHTWQYWSDSSFQSLAAQYDSVYFIGADTVDGQHSCSNTHHRLRLMYVAAKAARTVVAGVSFNRRRMDRCAPTLRFLRALLESNANIWTVQDPSSMRDVQSIPAPEKSMATKLILAADAAFLSPHLPGLTKNIEDVVNRLEIDKLVARKLIGVNLGLQSARKVESEQHLLAVATAICNIHNTVEADAGVSLVYIPFDYSPDQSDVRTAALFHGAIKKVCPAIASYVHTFGSNVLNSVEAKEVMLSMDLVITTRVCVGVSAMSVGVPAAILGVPPLRCAYMSRLMDLANLCSSVEEATQQASLTRFVAQKWRQRAHDKTMIAANRQKVELWAMKNVLTDEDQ